MNLPDEILRIIYEYNLNISIPNKMIYENVVEKKSNFAKRIQHWYKKNKIDSKMPILFLSDFTENPQQFDKWYVIRLFMKFYPREDLYHYPKYLIRTIYGNRGLTLEEQLGKDQAQKWKNLRSNWDVLKLMRHVELDQIVKTGW